MLIGSALLSNPVINQKKCGTDRHGSKPLLKHSAQQACFNISILQVRKEIKLRSAGTLPAKWECLSCHWAGCQDLAAHKMPECWCLPYLLQEGHWHLQLTFSHLCRRMWEGTGQQLHPQAGTAPWDSNIAMRKQFSHSVWLLGHRAIRKLVMLPIVR